MEILKQNKNYSIIIALTALLALALFIGNEYILNIFITTLFFTIIASAWNLMCGFTMEISLGHTIFIGIGQYTTAIFYTKMGISPWIGMWAGVVLSLIAAVIIGLISLRVKHYFFALITVALATILHILAVKFTGLTGGSVGISIQFDPSVKNMMFQSYREYYLLFLGLLFVILMTTAYIKRARLGTNLMAIREDDVAASALGINLLKEKVIALGLSAAFSSIAGTFYVQYSLFVNPSGAFSLDTSIKAALYSIIGGAGTVFGPIIGGFILSPLETYLRGWLGGSFEGLHMLIYGAIVVIVIFYAPGGIFGKVKDLLTNSNSDL